MRPSTQAKGEEGGTQEVETRSLLGQGTEALISSCYCHKLVQARCLSNTDSLSSRLEGWKSTIGSPGKRPRGWQGYTASSVQDVTQEPILLLLRALRKPFYQQLELVLAEARLLPTSTPTAGFLLPLPLASPHPTSAHWRIPGSAWGPRHFSRFITHYPCVFIWPDAQT